MVCAATDRSTAAARVLNRRASWPVQPSIGPADSRANASASWSRRICPGRVRLAGAPHIDTTPVRRLERCSSTCATSPAASICSSHRPQPWKRGRRGCQSNAGGCCAATKASTCGHSRRQPRPSDTLRLAFAGSLIPSKAPHLLLEAVATLPPGRVTVDLFGANTAYHGDRSYSEVLAPLLGQPFIRKLGPIPHERMALALSDVDALVVPSVWIENAPFVIREAFAAGLPVVASNLGGMAEMVRHDQDGLLFDPGSAPALAAQIRRLLDEPALLAHLQRHVRPPMSIQDDARRLRKRYEQLLWTPDGEPRAPKRTLSSARLRSRSTSSEAVAAVVLNYRTPDQTWLATRSLQASTVDTQVWVVDNGSADGSLQRLAATLPAVHLLDAGRNRGFSGGCNLGIEPRSKQTQISFCSSTATRCWHPMHWQKPLRRREQIPRLVFAPVILSREEPDRVASAGIRFSLTTGRMRHVAAGRPLSLLPPAPAHHVDAVSGCAMLVRRDVFDIAECYFRSAVVPASGASKRSGDSVKTAAPLFSHNLKRYRVLTTASKSPSPSTSPSTTWPSRAVAVGCWRFGSQPLPRVGKMPQPIAEPDLAIDSPLRNKGIEIAVAVQVAQAQHHACCRKQAAGCCRIAYRRTNSH